MATFTIVCGASIAVSFASHCNPDVSAAVLFSYYSTARFIVYALLMAISIGGMHMATRYLIS